MRNELLNTGLTIFGLLYHVTRIQNSIPLTPDMEGNNGRYCTIPAARVESWGLFVLAYANGARLTQRQRTSDGSLRITLRCRDFIITILRQGATGPISTHLEPRTRSIDTYKPFRPDQWTHLLEQGYSYNEFDPSF